MPRSVLASRPNITTQTGDHMRTQTVEFRHKLARGVEIDVEAQVYVDDPDYVQWHPTKRTCVEDIRYLYEGVDITPVIDNWSSHKEEQVVEEIEKRAIAQAAPPDPPRECEL